MAAVTYAGILSQGYADERRLLIDPNQAMSSVNVENPCPYDPYYAGQTVNHQPSPDLPPVSGDTQTSSLMDKYGNMVALTATLSAGWGTGIIAPGTGIIFNNGMSKFNYGSAYAHHPNRVDSGKLLLNNMSAFLILKDGKPFITAGSMGGRRIMACCVKMIINVIDWGMNIQEAVDAPRYHVEVNTCSLESGTPSSIINGLVQMGHPCVTSRTCGQIHAIMLDPISGKQHAAYERRNPDSTAGGFVSED